MRAARKRPRLSSAGASCQTEGGRRQLPGPRADPALTPDVARRQAEVRLSYASGTARGALPPCARKARARRRPPRPRPDPAPAPAPAQRSRGCTSSTACGASPCAASEARSAAPA